MSVGSRCPNCHGKVYLPEPELLADKLILDNFIMNNIITPASEYNKMKGVWIKEEKLEVKQRVKFQKMQSII
jgi:hypothetical protein